MAEENGKMHFGDKEGRMPGAACWRCWLTAVETAAELLQSPPALLDELGYCAQLTTKPYWNASDAIIAVAKGLRNRTVG